jgi:hypothetical protein
MCCLSFEHEGYAGSKKCPKAAKIISAADTLNSIPQEGNKAIELEKMDNNSDFQ